MVLAAAFAVVACIVRRVEIIAFRGFRIAIDAIARRGLVSATAGLAGGWGGVIHWYGLPPGKMWRCGFLVVPPVGRCG